MTIQGYGYAINDYGSAWELDRQLSKLIEMGFTHAEVRPEGWQVWQNGQIDNRRLARLTAVLDKHRAYLDYVMQLPTAVNLFNLPQQKDHQHLLQQGIKVGAHIGAKLLMYQPGYRADRTPDDFIAMPHLMKQERRVLRQLADETARWGGAIAILSASYLAGEQSSYAVWPELLAQQVTKIDHPNVGLCLDFSQLFWAAKWVGFDFSQAIQTLSPLAFHFHIQDEMGIMNHPAPTGDSLTQCVTYLPAGWHKVPYQVGVGLLPLTELPAHLDLADTLFYPVQRPFVTSPTAVSA